MIQIKLIFYQKAPPKRSSLSNTINFLRMCQFNTIFHTQAHYHPFPSQCPTKMTANDIMNVNLTGIAITLIHSPLIITSFVPATPPFSPRLRIIPCFSNSITELVPRSRPLLMLTSGPSSPALVAQGNKSLKD